MPMKIAIVSNLYNPYSFGGAEVSTELLTQGLRQAGHQVFVISASMEGFHSRTDIVDEIPVYRVATALPYSVLDAQDQSRLAKVFWHGIDLWNPVVYSRVGKILRKEQPDVVHSNVLAGLSTCIWMAAHRCGIPVVHTLRDYYLVCARSNLIDKNGVVCEQRCGVCRNTGMWKHVMSKLPDAVAGISEFILEKHREFGLFKNTPSIIISNALAAGVESNREPVKKPQDQPLDVVFLGRMEIPKGPQVLLEALKLAPDLSLRLHLCGNGPLLEKLQETYGHDKRIIFEGRVDGDRKEAILRAADVMIVPSCWLEPFNRTIIEAYQYGLAVVASRIGGIPEIVEEGIAGRLFNPGDSRQLAEILMGLTASRKSLLKLQQNAMVQARKYLLAHHIKQYEAMYIGVRRSDR
jgi:glycosyltransferase involved in cell wall biosynthesis